jgi:hypothetical protein
MWQTNSSKSILSEINIQYQINENLSLQPHQFIGDNTHDIFHNIINIFGINSISEKFNRCRYTPTWFSLLLQPEQTNKHIRFGSKKCVQNQKLTKPTGRYG